MAITPPTNEAPLIYTALDIVTDALIEVQICAPGETPDPDTGQWAFRKLNYLLDTWSTSKKYVYASTWGFYTLDSSLPVMPDGSSQATIGPAPGATYRS